jgi:hypothetical protein
MARVNIPGVGPVEFADSLSDAEILTRARAIQAEAAGPKYDARDLPASELIKGGFSRGIEGIKGTAFDLLPALAGSMFGQKDYAREQLAEYRDRMAAEEAINPTAYRGTKDIQSLGDFGGFVAETVGEVAPDIASFLLGAGAGTVAGKAIAKRSATAALKEKLPEHVAKRQLAEDVASKLEQRVLDSARAKGASIGSTVGLFGTSMGQSVPETLNSIYEETGNLAPGLAITFGSLKGALDTYLPSKILKQLGPAGKDRVAAAMLEKSAVVPVNFKRAFLTEIAKTTGGEAVTEATQQAIDIVAAQVAGGTDPFFSPKNIDNILFAGLKGAVGGGTFGTPGAAFEASRIKEATAQEAARRQMIQQQEAEKQRQEQQQKAQEELARQQTATGDLFGQEVPQGPGIPSRTLAEKELAASPMEQKVQELFQEYLNTTSPVAKAAIEKEIKRLDAEGKLAKTSYERQGLLDLLGPLLGYTPGVSSARTQSIDTAPITVDQQGVARTPEQAEAQRITPQDVKRYQGDLFERELGFAQSQARAQGLQPSVDQALAGPPQAPAEFKTVLDAASLQGTGLRPQSGFFKKLLNKDMANPADQAAVRDILVQVRQNPNIADSTKQAIESLATQAFSALAKQTSVVGPQGGIRRDVNYGRVQPRPSVPEADRESVQVPSESVREEPTAGVGEPESEGVAAVGVPPSELRDRETVQSGALEPTAEEDFNTLKKLTKRRNDAERVARRAETGEETRKAKEKLQKIDDEIDAFNAESKSRRDRRIAELTKDNLSQEEQDAIQAELAAEMEGDVITEEGAPAGTMEGAGKVAPVARAKPAAKAAATEEVASKDVPEAAKDILKRTEQEQAAREKAAKIGNEEFPVQEASAPFNVSKGYMGFAKEDIADIDDSISITNLLRGKGSITPIAAAARIYFGKMPRIVDNLVNIAFDVAFNTPAYRMSPIDPDSTAEARFFRGMGGKNARLAADWVEKNLSKGTDRRFREFVRGFERARDSVSDAELMKLIMAGVTGTKEKAVDETIADYIRAQEQDAAAAKNRAQRRKATGKTMGADLDAEILEAQKSRKKRKLEADAVVTMSYPLHPAIISAVQNGDLQSALRLLASSDNPFIARMASRLAGLNLGAKIVVQDNLTDDFGKPVPGYFNPENNTIYVDSVTGMTPHVLLHEPGHAATSQALDDPNNPLTRQLQQIFDDVKGDLDTAYGAKDVHEFAAEIQSNSEFVGKLKTIYPKGGQISAWDKVTRAFTNFFRRLVGMESKPLSSAFDEADRIIGAMLSPSPASRNAGKLYVRTVADNQAIWNNVGKVVNVMPVFNENQKDALYNGIDRSADWAKSATLSVLPMHALGEVADPVFPLKDQDTPGLGSKFNKLINQRSGYQDMLTRGTDAAMKEAKDAIAAKPEQRDAFNSIVNDSTVNEVDPTKPQSAYADKFDKSGNSLEATWKDLNTRYKKLDTVWQNLYVTMRGAYKQMYEEIKNAINERIDATSLDSVTKNKVKTDIMKKLAEQGMIDPYFALGREGDKWLAFNYKDRNGQMQRANEAFTSVRARDRRIQDLAAMGVTEVEPYASIAEINYRNAPSGSFVNSVLNIMETNNVPDTAVDEMMRLFLTTLPETAFAQSFQKRGNKAGYMEDTIGVFERKMRSTAHQVANMAYNPKLSGVIEDMERFTTELGAGKKEVKDAQGNVIEPKVASQDNTLQAKYLEEFKKHLGYVLNPTRNDIGSILTSAAFTYTLGFNVSSMVVNSANIPMIVAPYLKAHYPEGQVARAIGDASKVFIGSGTNTEMEIIGGNGKRTKMRVMPSLTNYAPDSEMAKKYATLIRIGNEQGQFNRSQLYEIINGDTKTGFLAKFNAMSGWMMHHGERMNREVTMVAAYNLEMNKLAKDVKAGKMSQLEAETKAANKAIYTTELTNGGISAASAPRIAQSSLGKILFMYKRYGISMYYMLFKAAKEALKGETPEIKKAAWRQIGGIVGMSALMAGAQGIPMFGALSMLYSLFCDEDDEDLDTVTQKALGDFLYKGPLEYMTNLGIAGRITLNDLIVRDAPKGSATTFTQQLLQAVGGPVIGVSDRIQRGYSKIGEGNVYRGLEELLPTAISNGLKSFRYVSEGTTTLRGDPITGDVNLYNGVAQLLGFAPADYQNQLEINSREKGIDTFLTKKIGKLKQKYYIAKREGDFAGMESFKEDLLDLGEKHPELGINGGTITDILSNSLRAQERATREMVNGVRYSKKRLETIKASQAEYED